MNADEESGGQTPTADPAPSARPPRWWRSLKGAFVLVLINGLILIFAVPSLRGGASRLGTKIAAAFLPQESTEEGWWYVCPMHLFYRKKQPGECGICGMTLVKKQAAELAVGAGTTISLSTRHVQLAGITSVEVDRRKLTRAVRTTGRIAYDERQIKYATAWLAGRIEEVHVDFTGVRVAAGDPLVELYSPDAIQSQAEYLNARRTLAAMRERRATDDEQVFQRRLVESSRTRLLRWGITEAQLEGLEREGAVADRITIYAPIAGTVVEKDAFAGRYVKAGSNLYQIVPLDPVWLYADIYEYEIPFVAVGQQVRAAVRAFPDHTFRGTVSFIDPFLQERTRTARVRCVFPNPDQRLKPGMYAEATIEVDLGEKLVVPTSAVVRSGDLDYVFVDAGAGQFDVRAVEIGPMVKDLYPVRQGLSSGERVVLTGAFLLSSESQLRGALSKLEAGTEFTLPGLGPEEHAIAGRGSAGNPRCAWDGMAMPA
ncbi:MAG: efflux RND transporter periplasmic adaptor subunit, partial [Planctomycetota bacterium]